MDDHQLFEGGILDLIGGALRGIVVRAVADPVDGRTLVRIVREDGRGEPFQIDCGPLQALDLADLLRCAADFAQLLDDGPHPGLDGVHRLPTVSLCGTEFFLDKRLRQLRNVSNPHHFFDLDDPSRP